MSCHTIHYMIRGIRALAASLAQGPYNPAKILGQGVGGGKMIVKKSAACTCTCKEMQKYYREQNYKKYKYLVDYEQVPF